MKNKPIAVASRHFCGSSRYTWHTTHRKHGRLEFVTGWDHQTHQFVLRVERVGDDVEEEDRFLCVFSGLSFPAPETIRLIDQLCRGLDSEVPEKIRSLMQRDFLDDSSSY